MVKRYLKYITITLILLISFSVKVKATNTINMNVTENDYLCKYEYDGITILIGRGKSGNLHIEDSGDPKTYFDYGVYLNGQYDTVNCSDPIYAFSYKTPIAGGTYEDCLYFLDTENSDPNSGNVDFSTRKLIAKIEGKKVGPTQCTYSVANPNYSSNYKDSFGNDMISKNYEILYTYDFGANKLYVETINNDNYSNLKISSGAKKALKYSKTQGLICDKNSVVIDICTKTTSSQGTQSTSKEVYFRAENEAMLTEDSNHYSCSASTNPKSGITIIAKENDTTATKILPLSDICNSERNVMIVVRFIGYLLLIVKILIPFGLIVIGIINFSKAIITGNEEDLKKSTQSFGIKIVIAIVIFVLPTIINFIIGLIDGATDGVDDYQNCRNCIFDPGNCNIPEK